MSIITTILLMVFLTGAMIMVLATKSIVLLFLICGLMFILIAAYWAEYNRTKK